VRRPTLAALITLVLVTGAGCGAQPAGPGIDGHLMSPAELKARNLAHDLHGKFAYLGRAGTASHVFEVSGPGLSDLLAIRLARDGSIDSIAFDPQPLLRRGLPALFTSG